jgi:hypothetical protein
LKKLAIIGNIAKAIVTIFAKKNAKLFKGLRNPKKNPKTFIFIEEILNYKIKILRNINPAELGI